MSNLLRPVHLRLAVWSAIVAVLAGAAVGTSPVQAATAVHRVNAGGAAVSGTPAWAADTKAAPSTLVNAAATGNTTYSTTNAVALTPSVPAGTPAALFQTQRYDAPGGEEMIWTFPVQPGRYEVRLYLAEIYWGTSKAGARVFDVHAEGELRLDDLDVFVAAGGSNKGIVKSFIVASDASLGVSFTHVVENPMVQAIEVLPVDASPGTLVSTPSSVPFGEAVVGGTATRTVTLTNGGGPGDPVITLGTPSLTGSTPSQFAFGAPGSTSLAPGASTGLQVQFKPTSTGSKSATLSVPHSGSASPLLVPLSGSASSSVPVGFGKSVLAGETSSSPTSLQFGPDGRLYVGQFDGLVKVYDIVRNGPNSYAVTKTQTIASVQAIPNHNDDGSLAPGTATRIITGLLVAGTAANPVVYLTSSDPRIGGGSAGTDLGLDTNSSMLSRLTWTGSTWDKKDLVRGLPRSEENHSANGIALDAASGTLFIAQGGNTNAGAPSNNFAKLPEYALSAALLSVDLDAIGETTYDLPTLDDSARSGTTDAGDPFGGNDGANQAKLVAGGPVQVHAPGFRNPYDVLIASNGKMYTVDNGGNAGWGAPPVGEGPAGTCTNALNEPGVSDPDGLHLVSGPGYYGGHPNPTRANKGNTFSSPAQSPVSAASAVECDYRKPGGAESSTLTTFPGSTNGLAEYTTGNFGGVLSGDLLAAGYSANAVYRVELNSAGTAVTSSTVLFSNVGAQPLDVVAQRADQPFGGTVWVADIGTGQLVVFEPNDFGGSGGGCTGADSPSLDEDGDQYSNADEIDNGTSPCSSADVPADADLDHVSDLNDPDDDGDGAADTSDPFARDAKNGLGTGVPLAYNWDNGSPAAGGLLGLGFTGLMTNGSSNYASLYDPAKMTAGGAAGVATVDAVPGGDALGGSNTQQYGFQLGVAPPSGVFTAHTRLVGPFAGLTPSGQMSLGLSLGTGTQDDYVKLVATAGGGSPGVQVVKELGGVVTTGTKVPLALPGPDSVDLYLTVDPAASTVQAAFRTTSGSTAVGTPMSIPAAWLTSATQGLAIGIIATSAGGQPFPATWDGIDVALGGVSSGPPTYRVNAGGAAVSGTPAWSADTAAQPSPYVNATATANKVFTTTKTVTAGPGVPPGLPQSVLQTQRWDPSGGEEMTWSFPVTPGAYDVRLYLAETYSGNFAVGKRVFDVSVEGRLALDDVDIFAAAGGGNKAIVRTVPVQSDATLTVQFAHVVENPAVQAIEILPRQAPPGQLSASPTSLSFPSTAVGSSSTASVALTNSGPAGSPAVTISGVGLSGPAAAEFGVTPSGSATLEPGQSSTRTVTFTPTSGGARAANLVVTHDGEGGQLLVPLSGSATAPAATDQGAWTADPPMPTPRAEVGVAAVGTKVYVVGGKTDSTGLSNAVSVYDTVAKTWATAPPVPGPARDHAGVVTFGGKVYVMGGLTGYPGPAVSSLHVFDPATGAWTAGPAMPTARGAMGVAVAGGRIWAAGGLGGGVAVKDVAAYDPAAGTWSVQPAMPTARHHLSGEAFDGTFYAIGGRTGSLTGNVGAVEALDTRSGAWTARAPMPVGRGGAGSAVLNGRVYVFGGDGNPASGSGGVYDLTDEYDPASNTWRSVAPLPTGRHGTDGAVVGQAIYAPGGGTAQGVHDSAVNEVLRLDLRGAWTALPAMPQAVRESATAALGTKIYVVGGNTGNEVRTNAVRVFDTATQTWSTAPPYPGGTLDHFGWAVVEGKLYVVGGLEDVPTPGSTAVHSFDPATQSWTAGTPLPVDVGAAGAAAIGTKIYVVGGYTGGVRSKSLRIYDTVTKAWSTGPSMPTARDHVKAEAVDGRLYAIGGFVTGYPSGVTSKVEVFDPSTGTWTEGAPMPTPRGDVASVVVNGRILLYGGINGSGISGLAHEYDPANDLWRPLTPMAVPLRAASGAVVGGRLFAFGGSNGTYDPSVATVQSFQYR